MSTVPARRRSTITTVALAGLGLTAATLAEHPRSAAVYIVTPSYFGAVADVAAIAAARGLAAVAPYFIDADAASAARLASCWPSERSVFVACARNSMASVI